MPADTFALHFGKRKINFSCQREGIRGRRQQKKERKRRQTGQEQSEIILKRQRSCILAEQPQGAANEKRVHRRETHHVDVSGVATGIREAGLKPGFMVSVWLTVQKMLGGAHV